MRLDSVFGAVRPPSCSIIFWEDTESANSYILMIQIYYSHVVRIIKEKTQRESGGIPLRRPMLPSSHEGSERACFSPSNENAATCDAL